MTAMLQLVAHLVEPIFAYRLKRRSEAVRKLLARIRFLSTALDERRDFSGVHHFPDWIDNASNQVSKLEPSNRDAICIRDRLPEFRARAAEIVARRRPVSADSDAPL